MSETAFLTALAEFQADIPAIDKAQTATVDSQRGRSYSYTYADLALVSEALLPLLAKHGLSFTARPTLDNGAFVLAYALSHREGHRDSGVYPLPDPANSTPQQIGSVITYARRYCLLAVTGAMPKDEDDDGQKASEARSAPVNNTGSLRAQIAEVGRQMTWDRARIEADFTEWSQGQFIGDIDDAATLTAYRDYLDAERRRGNREHKQLVADVHQTTQAGKQRKDSTDRGRVERTDTVPEDPGFLVDPAEPVE